MKIANVEITRFRHKTRTTRDAEGHAHPGPETDASSTILEIKTDCGASGYAFGASPQVFENIIGPAIIGEDAFARERVWQKLNQWQRLHRGILSDGEIAACDEALWDLAGRHLNTPVYKLIGSARDKVPAYASTMCGDDLEGGLDTPEAYAKFAAACVERGYKAIKLHTWMPPLPGTPDPKRDVEACSAIRERVGPDIKLMLDCYHFYTREEAYFLGRELEKLNFHWIEEPMDEQSISAYAWLTAQLDIPVVGPETAGGKHFNRAEWILRNASDISRAGVRDVGGITPVMKVAHLCEAHGVTMEIHGGGPGNLHALCAMGRPGEFYERGLLHPFIDYEEPSPWLNSIPDPMDEEGYVHISQEPGLGWDINFDYIEANRE